MNVNTTKRRSIGVLLLVVLLGAGVMGADRALAREEELPPGTLPPPGPTGPSGPISATTTCLHDNCARKTATCLTGMACCCEPKSALGTWECICHDAQKCNPSGSPSTHQSCRP
ncbi:MAG: hypothetical protein IBJ11_06110 [Phycisphaerales bacterium]|nr:hypothetical protein [Phycisphaerales bacterium]